MRYVRGMAKPDPILPVVYVTKFALTKGVLAYKNVKHCTSVGNGGMISTGGLTCYHKPFWYENLSDALAHVEKLRRARIASLQREIVKLNNLLVEIHPVAQDDA